jgi:Mg/Co/Ni transporter MgtE
MKTCQEQQVSNGNYASNEHDTELFQSCGSHVTLSIVADIDSASICRMVDKMKNLLQNKYPEMSVMTIQRR